MAKIIGVIVTLLLLNTAMFIFTFSGECKGADCDISGYNTEASDNIWDYFTDPSQQSQSSFWGRLFGAAGLLTLITGGGLIVAGAVWFTKDINVAYISLMVFLVTGVIGTWVRFWGLVNDSNFILGGESGGVIAMIMVGTLLAVQLFNLADWGRGMS